MASTSAAAASAVSSQAFLTSLVLNLVVAGVEVAIFVLIFKRFRKVFQPRTYLVPPKNRVQTLPTSLFGWLPAVLKTPTTDIISRNGLDAYTFVRFLELNVKIFLPITALTFIVLLPVYGTGKGGLSGVDQFTFGNIAKSQTNRYAASLILVWFITFYILYLIKNEYAAFIPMRQDFLMSKAHSRLAQSKTVLVTGVPAEYLSVESMTKLCTVLPGGVKRVWIARDLGELPDVFDRRLAATSKLESAETSYLKAATQAIFKAAKSKKPNAEMLAPTPEELEQDPSLISRYVPEKDRPTHKLGFLGLLGKKVDSINWARTEIADTDKELLEAQAILRGSDADVTYPKQSAAFVQFSSQSAAHVFAQILVHHAPLRMAARHLEVSSEDVIWGNLSIAPYQAKVRKALSWVMTIGLIVLWSIPVAFVGILTNVSALCIKVPFLGFLCKLPSPVNGIIQGALPPIGLAVLFILLPIILRIFARFEGIPLNSLIEVSLMSRFFLFLVIHGFLIVTLAAGLVAAIPSIIANPSSTVSLLATKLPAASTFFLTYFVTVGLGGAAGALLQIVTLIVFYVKLYLLSSTPRSVFGIRYNMSTVQWGTLYPNQTLLTVIGLTYSIIAPIVASMALLAFGLLAFVYKYLFLYVYDCPPTGETAGRYYPLALGHIFVGLYVEMIALAGLFFLASDENGKQSAIAEGILMVVLIVIVVFFQQTMSSGYGPLIDYLPLSSFDRIHEIENEANSPDPSNGSGEFASPKTVTSESNEHKALMSPNYADKSLPVGGAEMSRTSTRPGDEHLDVHAFDHPATYVVQRTVWIPADAHGFYKTEVSDSRSAGIDISSAGATMSADKGAVHVDRSPPDEEWDASQTI